MAAGCSVRTVFARWRPLTLLLVIAAVVTVVVVFVTVLLVRDRSRGMDLKTRSAEADVTVFAETCRDDAGVGRVSLSVRNSTSTRADYVITVSFLDSRGGTIGEGLAVMRKVKSGRTSNGDALGSLVDESTLDTCRLGTVSRSPAL